MFIVFTFVFFEMKDTDGPSLTTGVSKELADYRHEVLSQITYTLQFDISAQQEDPIPATETMTFYLKENHVPLQIDFKEKTDHLKTITVNEKEIPVEYQQEHILIAPKFLKKGKNQIHISFTAGDLSLNRNEDFLYTLLVPDRARTVFPCFDQPNLKAVFQLTLTIPEDWKAVSNGPLKDTLSSAGSTTYHFAPSDTLSTYLFSFAAGKFKEASQRRGWANPAFFSPGNRCR